jgi:hypothetical protein
MGRTTKRSEPTVGNVLEYWEVHPDGKLQHSSWITDLGLTPERFTPPMRGGRARWKIENETFNTLKNQGYCLEHSFGHGEKNLSVGFALLMVLAFFVDQVQQLCCPLFQAALAKKQGKCYLRRLLPTSLRVGHSVELPRRHPNRSRTWVAAGHSESPSSRCCGRNFSWHRCRGVWSYSP